MSKAETAGQRFIHWYETASGSQIRKFAYGIQELVAATTKLEAENAQLRSEVAKARGEASNEWINKNTRPSRVPEEVDAAFSATVRAAALNVIGDMTFEQEVTKAKEEVQRLTPAQLNTLGTQRMRESFGEDK